MKYSLDSKAVSFSIDIQLSSVHQREFLQVALNIINEGREEQGNNRYNLQRDTEEDFHYEINAEWTDGASLENYIGSQYYGALMGALNVLTLEFDVKICELSFQEGTSLIRQIRNQ